MQGREKETLPILSCSSDRSTYYESLDPLSKQRYNLKIQAIAGLDPYSLPKNVWNKDYSALPEIAIPDLYTYLVLGRSFYTNDQFKAYKGLQAYNQFVSGWVQEVVSYQHQDVDNILVKAKVGK
ncbi:hypothetical protein ElyMa_001219300 [Elysia marginata]|uniref:Uncharacterized protein n=1 Tax=Elysia marginata TaxID=1093978 RepID=A0AAV4IAW8_9GAST|nr:hypothetical protein ElyMa_001219300 [Elysia marginata]